MNDSVPGFRLSPQQRRLWRLQPPVAIHRAQCVLSIEGEVDAHRLSAALRALVNRHEILRTGFVRPPGIRTPVQVVRESGSVLWSALSLPALDEAGREVELARIWRREAGRPFDLEGGPVLHACLVTLEPGRHQLFLTLPALCADAASLGRLVEELAAAAVGELDGEEPVQYLQYGEWKHELLLDDEAGGARRHWRTLEVSAAGRLRLPWERAAPEDAGFSPERVRQELDPAVAARLAALAAAGNAGDEPVAPVLLACWQVLLARLTGEREPMVGCVLSGRRYEDLAGVIGPVAETVPVPGRVRPEDRFLDVLARASEDLAAAGLAQDDFAADELFPPRPGETGLRVGFEHQRLASAAAAGLRFSVLRQEVLLERFAVKLTASRGEGGLALELHYDPALLSARDAERLIGSLRLIVDAVAQAPTVAVADLEILGGAERGELLDAFNDTRREVPRRCLHELFAERAARAAGETAVVCGVRSLTYGELDRRANQLAWHLRFLGVGPDALVALCLDRSPEMLIAMLAVLKAGGAYLPLDTGHPAERLAFLLADARPAVLVTEERLRELIPHDRLPRVLLDVDRETIGSRQETSPAVPIAGENLAYVLYTSGSTGRPKGVMITHHGLVNYLSWAVEAYGVAAGGRSPVHSPLGFDLTVTALFAPLLAGGTVELLPEEQGIEALAGALRSGGEYGLVKLTPAHLEILEQQLAGGARPAGVRSLVVGGEALFAGSLASWWSRSPETRVFNEYGPTETVVGSCVHEVLPGRDAAGPVAIGRPIANTRVYLLDPGFRPVPAGVPAEVYIGGAGVARGYRGRPDLTAERFVPDPFSGSLGVRLYRTGDLARHLDEGGLQFLGRNDDQVKIRGFRIELGEVEAALKRLPGIRDAVVLAREEVPGSRRLLAYLVASEGAPGLEELRSALLDELPEPMIPAAFVWLEALPLTANGKVDRSRLPAPDARRPDLSQGFVAPRTPVEEILAEVWGQVLGLERIGIHDSFFTLGGDSIRSVRLVAAAQARGLTFTVQQLFRHQTIADLAGHLEISAGLAAAPAAAETGEDDPELLRLVAELEGLPADQVRDEIRGLMETTKEDRS